MTFNLRSLKNFINLRANNAAYFQIRWLAEEIVKATPKKFINLIVKQDKIDKICNK
jgi:thymidylate synthase (FAD)